MRRRCRCPAYANKRSSGAHLVESKDGPFTVVIFKGTEILDPIARVHIDDLGLMRGDTFHLGLMDVTTHDMAIPLPGSRFNCRPFKVTHILDCQLHTAFDTV